MKHNLIVSDYASNALTNYTTRSSHVISRRKARTPYFDGNNS